MHNKQQGLTVHLSCDYAPAGRAPMVETTVYRLVQESLNNVRLHAQAAEAHVELRKDGDRLALVISDAGRGFDTTLGIEGFGLHGLRERAKAVGGEVRIQSSPGRGTVVTALLPPLDPVDSAARERDHAAAALAVNRLRLQHILDGTTAVIFVKDHEFRYELINHQWGRLFDKTRDEVIGYNDFDLFPHDVATKLRENDARVLAENRPITVEESVPSSNGELREYVVAKFPIPGEKGGPNSLCGIATDITEQKRQMRALEEIRGRFTAFMDNSPLLAWIKDSSGRYVYTNRRTLEVLQLRREQMIGHTDFDIFPAESARSLQEHDMEVLAEGGSHEFREFCPIGSGPPLPWQSCKFRLQAGDGSYLVGGVALDVSAATCSTGDTV